MSGGGFVVAASCSFNMGAVDFHEVLIKSLNDLRLPSTFALSPVEELRAQALAGLAVNSNRRLGDPERALVDFEAAYKLDDSDFMRGLLACYRARFGATEEARSLLRTIRPAPAVDYNLAGVADAPRFIKMTAE